MTLTVGPYPFFCEPDVAILWNSKIPVYRLQLVAFKPHPSQLHSSQASIAAPNSPKDCATQPKIQVTLYLCRGLTPASSQEPTQALISFPRRMGKHLLKSRKPADQDNDWLIGEEKAECASKAKRGVCSLLPINRQMFSPFLESSISAHITVSWEDEQHNHVQPCFLLLSLRFCCWARHHVVCNIPLVYLGHPQPTHWAGNRVRNRECLDTVQALLNSTQNSAVLSVLSFQNTAPCSCYKKANPILAGTSTIPHQNVYKIDKARACIWTMSFQGSSHEGLMVFSITQNLQ